jgi:uncharacterized membrane protein
MLGIGIALFVWVFGILFLPFLIDDITTFRTDMDCSNTSISGGSMLVCLAGGITAPLWIWTILSLAIGFIIGGGK